MRNQDLKRINRLQSAINTIVRERENVAIEVLHHDRHIKGVGTSLDLEASSENVLQRAFLLSVLEKDLHYIIDMTVEEFRKKNA